MHEDEMKFTAILQKALAEQATLPAEPGGVAWTDAADDLGDSLYRLCIEFGVEFNEFRRTVLAEVPHQSRRSDDTPSPERHSHCLVAAGPHVELVILALELMREDSEF